MVQGGDLACLHPLVGLELAAQALQLIHKLPPLIADVGDVLESALLGTGQPANMGTAYLLFK